MENDQFEPEVAVNEAMPQIGAQLLNFPGFGWAGRAYARMLELGLEKTVDRFNSLNSISDEEKNRIRPGIAKAFGQVLVFEAMKGVINEIISLSGYAAIIVGMVFTLFSALIWFQADRNALDLVLVVIIAYAVFFIASYYLWKLQSAWSLGIRFLRELYHIGRFGRKFLEELYHIERFRREWREFLEKVYNVQLKRWESAWALLLASVYILAVLVLSNWRLGFPGIMLDGMRAGLLGGAVALLLGFISYSLSVFGAYIIERSKRLRYPEADVVYSLFWSLHLAEIKSLADKASKSEVLKHLENIADRLETELPRKLTSYDPETDIWLQNCGREMAAGMRQLKRFVLLPRAGSQERLKEVLRRRLVNAADGNWDHFERREPSPVPSKWSKGFQLLWEFLPLAFPLLIVVAIKISPFHLDEQLESYITTVAIGFVVLYILAKLDPMYKDKIEAFKSGRDILKRG